MEFNKDHRYMADAYMNQDFILLSSKATLEGFFVKMRDILMPEYHLPLDVEDAQLGEKLLAVLSKSRMVPKQEFADYGLDKRISQLNEVLEIEYDKWISDLMARYGYKTKRALFKKMKRCFIDLENDEITIQPTHHDQLDGWGVTKAGPKSIPVRVDASHAEIGATLRRGFSSCR